MGAHVAPGKAGSRVRTVSKVLVECRFGLHVKSEAAVRLCGDAMQCYVPERRVVDMSDSGGGAALWGRNCLLDACMLLLLDFVSSERSVANNNDQVLFRQSLITKDETM